MISPILTKISFTHVDKPESHSFNIDSYIEYDNAIIYKNINRLDGYKKKHNEFYSFETIFNSKEKFDLIIETQSNMANLSASSNSITRIRYILPKFIKCDTDESDGCNNWGAPIKLESLLIEPLMCWVYEGVDIPMNFIEVLTSIRREIKLSRLGI